MSAAKKPEKKTAAVRAVLKAKSRPLSFDEIRAGVERRLKSIIGKQALYILLAGLKKAGEVDTVGRADDRFYHLIKK